MARARRSCAVCGTSIAHRAPSARFCVRCLRDRDNARERAKRAQRRRESDELDRLPVGPIREAFERQRRLTATEVALAVGLLGCGGNGDASKLKRTLGIVPTRGTYTSTIDHALGVHILHTLGLDPVDVGV